MLAVVDGLSLQVEEVRLNVVFGQFAPAKKLAAVVLVVCLIQKLCRADNVDRGLRWLLRRDGVEVLKLIDLLILLDFIAVSGWYPVLGVREVVLR